MSPPREVPNVETPLGAPSVETANADLLRIRIGSARTANIAYLGIATPTAAQQRQQVDRLTRQVNALTALLLGNLDSTDGT